jgi:hypothetical protein
VRVARIDARAGRSRGRGLEDQFASGLIAQDPGVVHLVICTRRRWFLQNPSTAVLSEARVYYISRFDDGTLSLLRLSLSAEGLFPLGTTPVRAMSRKALMTISREGSVCSA